MTLPNNWGFCDLCVSDNFDFSKLADIEKLGYKTIAVNTYVKDVCDEPKQKKKRGEVKEKVDFPPPVRVDNHGTKLNILSRITLEFSDTGLAHKLMNSQTLKLYDIIAIVPKNLNSLHYFLVNTHVLDIDIIAMQYDIRLPYKMSRKQYKVAVDRGICFELPYAPMIKDSMSRKNIIAMGHNLYTIGRLKNAIITSNADHIDYIRSPYDVINLGFLFGLNEHESTETIRSNSRKLIIKATSKNARKLYLTFMEKTDKEKDENKT